MRNLLLFVLLLFVFTDVYPQPKRSGKVKRKYRNVEAVNQNLPPVFVHGKVMDADQELIIGATVTVRGTLLNVNSNEDGEYFLKGLPTGVNSLMVSKVGYKTKIIDYYLQEGVNDVYFTLDRDDIVIEPVTITAQRREQQLLDMPATISTLNGNLLESAQMNDWEKISDFVPGMNVRVQTPHRPTISIRGLTSDEVSPAAQPRVSVYFNQVPTSRASMAITELYDMERVEVTKGPQGTLFARGAQIGAVSFITRKPSQEFEGYLTTGYGNFGQKELQGAVNVPFIDNKLMMRASGIYNYHDGYVKNTFGGNLNGKNTAGGRFSVRYLPFYNTKADLVIHFQKDDNPGTAFMSKLHPNSNGVNDIFKYEASLDQGKNLHNKRDVFGTSLDIRHFRNENNYFSSLTSFYTNTADSRWDGDGTQAPAIDMAENVDVKQITQELRYNFSLKSRVNGFVGLGYWREKVDQRYWFGPNEQYMSYLIFQMPEYLIQSDFQAYPMTNFPQDPQLGGLSGMPLPGVREELNLSGAVNKAIDLFGDVTLKIRPRLSLTAGLRGTYEKFSVTNESKMLDETPSMLGILTGSAPNLFFKPVPLTQVEESFYSYTGRINLKFDFNTYSNMFAGYSLGRRPQVIQFNREGISEVMDQELVHSFDAGFKYSYMHRIWFDAGAFYQLYRNFQVTEWDAATMNYLIKDAGLATAYGVEATFKAALLHNVEIFGNYAWIHARFDEKDKNGDPQDYAGNRFRLTPDHSFAVGLNAKTRVVSGFNLFAVPTYSWKSHIWFEDANTPGLEQDAYGLLNFHGGGEFENIGLTVGFTGSNLLDDKHIISAGNTGMMFGVPTFVPGYPRMMGIRVTWRF